MNRVRSSLVLTVPLAVHLILAGGCQSTESTAPAAAADAPREFSPPPPPVRTAPQPKPAAPDPLAGSRWSVVSMIGAGVQSSPITVEFQPGNRFVMTTWGSGGGKEVDERQYTVKGDSLILRDAVGAEMSMTFRRFGNDLTINAPRARVRLRQAGGAEEVGAFPETESHGTHSIPDDPDHALRGTSWSIVSTMGNVPLSYTGGTFEFKHDGRVTMNLARSDRTTNVLERRYRVSGAKLVFLDPLGMVTPVTLTLRGGRLALDLPSARVNLKRQGG